MQHFTTNLRQHIIYLTMAGCTLQFSPITAVPWTILIQCNEHRSNNNTIFDGTDYETCYKTNLYISMFLDHHICVNLWLIDCTIRLSLLRRELRVDELVTARQRRAILLQCYLILERAEDSHSEFGN